MSTSWRRLTGPSGPRAVGTALLLCVFAGPLSAQTASEVDYPVPSGPHSVGVTDFDFVDTRYPVDRPEDEEGRRIMVRAWYPTNGASGQTRSYFEGVEQELYGGAMADALGGLLPGAAFFDPIASVATHSYVDAPPDQTLGPRPTLVFSHGGLAYLSQNTALMEELASHGYVVFSVSHPGGSSAVLYPDGGTVRFDAAFRDAIFGLVGPTGSGRGSHEVGVRYEAALGLVDEGGLGPWAPRWRDDMIAAVDFIAAGEGDGRAAEVIALADLGQLGYFGMSYGASAAVSAAQIDPRARAAVNFDGTHFLSDVLDKEVRVPLLAITSEGLASYSNEFFFESLETMGDREDIVRFWIPGITHMELMDMMYAPAATRQQLPGGGVADGARVGQIVNGFVLGFFDHHLLGRVNGYPDVHFERYPEVRELDLRYVKRWARTRSR